MRNDFHLKVFFKIYLHIIMKFKSVIKVEEILHFVVRYTAVNDCLLTSVHDYERQLEMTKFTFIGKTNFL